MLGEEYLRDSRERGKQPRTMEGRESRLNAHILPTIGDVPVTKWRVEHSRKVMEKGSKTLFSQRGREDLRGQLSAMRKLAWRLGWLDRSIDPLDGLEIGRANVLHGATAQYVDPHLRPETRQVRAMAAAADLLCGPEGTDPLMTRLPLFGTKIRVAGFGGLRLGEQNALRAIDVFFEHGYVHVNGSWITPRGQAGFRGPVKNHTLHEVPLPKSLMHDELLPRVRELLDLPAKASLQQVTNAKEAERQRRASLAQREKDKSLAWWNYPVPPEDELWLFVDTVTGLPVKPEMHNERWHRVRAWVDANDLVASGGQQVDIAWATEQGGGLGIFVRSLVGLDRSAAIEAFETYLDGTKFTADQVRFVNLIVDELTKNGVMEPARLFESPYTDHAPTGPDYFFPDADVEVIVETLDKIKRTAVPEEVA